MQLVDTASEVLDGLDIVVNNAAFQMAQIGGIADITTEQFDRVLKTNLYALFWISKRAAEIMDAGSTIINTTSIQASNPSPELMDYATTKAGIVAFTKGLAGDLAGRGIRVNAVAPGPIWTPLIPATMPAEKYEKFGETVPLGTTGPTRGIGTGICLPGIERIELHHRRDHRGHRRHALQLISSASSDPRHASSTPFPSGRRHGRNSATASAQVIAAPTVTNDAS